MQVTRAFPTPTSCTLTAVDPASDEAAHETNQDSLY